MELKLFAAKRNYGFSGGLIVVAAETIEHAYELYKEYGEKHKLYQEGWYNDYPFENWYEIDDITVKCEEPQVIDEDGHTE